METAVFAETLKNLRQSTQVIHESRLYVMFQGLLNKSILRRAKHGTCKAQDLQFCFGTCHQDNRLGISSVDGMILLKWIFQKQAVNMK
jgi:hypothetical protein